MRALDRGDGYSAYTTSVYFNDDTGAVAVFAASACGQLIYWPNILMSTATSYENKILMVGTQCFKVASIDVRIVIFLCQEVMELAHDKTYHFSAKLSTRRRLDVHT